ncbi:hypothetical protein [Rickettsia felis]|uniref:hypothetical protein n=1 Tax=Rickettsia felis TaxID=42862 RepID=UPI001584534E|nr:hypothetical protein [Rickettsia felis]
MRGNYVVIDEAISRVCYYFMRLPRSFQSLAMTKYILHQQSVRRKFLDHWSK